MLEYVRPGRIVSQPLAETKNWHQLFRAGVGAVRLSEPTKPEIATSIHQLTPDTADALGCIRFVLKNGWELTAVEKKSGNTAPFIPGTQPLGQLFRGAANRPDLPDKDIPHDLMEGARTKLLDYGGTQGLRDAHGLFWIGNQAPLKDHVDLVKPGIFLGHWNLSPNNGMPVLSATGGQAGIISADGHVNPYDVGQLVQYGDAHWERLGMNDQYFFSATAVHKSDANKNGDHLRFLMMPGL